MYSVLRKHDEVYWESRMREIRPSGLTRGKAALTTSHTGTEAHKGKPGNMLDRRLNPNVPSLLYS